MNNCYSGIQMVRISAILDHESDSYGGFFFMKINTLYGIWIGNPPGIMNLWRFSVNPIS